MYKKNLNRLWATDYQKFFFSFYDVQNVEEPIFLFNVNLKHVDILEVNQHEPTSAPLEETPGWVWLILAAKPTFLSKLLLYITK